MSKYYVTHSCGHEERVDLIGPKRTREWRLERMTRELCDDCWRAKREQERAEAAVEAAKANQEAELPPLVGTEKQIPWAETIRANLLKRIHAEVEGNDWYYREARDDPQLPAALDALYQRTEARWWIDQRDTSPYMILLAALKAVRMQPVVVPDTDAALAAQAEATIRPAAVKTETVAEIRVSDAAIAVRFPERREDFRTLMRTLHYRWDETAWRRKIDTVNNSLTDRVAEVAHRLLAAGFAVRLYDAALRQRAVAGQYAPEQHRWVKKHIGAGPYMGWFVLIWPRTEDYYQAAKRIAGSRYSDGGVYIPPEHFAEVLDFAEIYKFGISVAAQELAETASQFREQTLVAQVAPRPKAEKPPTPSKTPPKLTPPEDVGVDAALCDDADLSDDHQAT